MNLVILLLLLANVAGVYYSQTQLPPRPSQYPQAYSSPAPDGVAILSLRKMLQLAKTKAKQDNGLELSFDAQGWGDSEAQAAKIQEASAWDNIGDNQTQNPSNNSAIALNPIPTKTIKPRKIELNDNPDLPPPVIINLIDMPQTDHKIGTQAPDSPVFELSPPVFAQIKTTESPQIVLNEPDKINLMATTTEAESSAPVTDKQIIITADIANSLLKGLEANISHNPFSQTQKKPILSRVNDAFAAQDSITPQLTIVLASKQSQSLNLSQVDPQFLGELQPIVTTNSVDKEPPPLIIKTPYTAQPDASDLVFALAGSSQLAHLQTQLPSPEPSPSKQTLSTPPKVEKDHIETREPIKLVWQCYRTGVFKRQSTAKRALSWWQAKTSKVKLIKTQYSQKSNIQLYLPAFANKTEATLAMKHLKQVGIAHYLLKKPKYAIAVGTFSTERNARKQRNKLKKYGYHQVKQKNQNKINKRYYLSLEINQQQQDWLNDFAQAQRLQIPQKTSNCPIW